MFDSRLRTRWSRFIYRAQLPASFLAAIAIFAIGAYSLFTGAR